MPSETGRILLALFIAYLAARTAGEAFARVRLPAVVGEVLAGIVLGPSVLGWIHPDATLETVATLGAIVLLFQVGLETPVSDLVKVGKPAALVAVWGVALPLAAGYGVLLALGQDVVGALFGGAALVATSVGVTARVLADEGLSSTREAKLVLAAAVIDDILGLLVLAFVAGLGRGNVDLIHLGLVVLMAVSFVAFQMLVAPKLIARGAHLVGHLKIEDAPLAVALVGLLGLSALAEVMGLAAIVGAFFAGMAISSTADRWELHERVRPLAGLLVPYFFVLAGMHVDLGAVASSDVLLPGALLVVVAFLTKILGGVAGAWNLGWQRGLAVGMGIVPRGEVGLIVASIGLTLNVVSASLYGMIVLVVIITTAVAPPALGPVFRWACNCELPASAKGWGR